MDTKSKTSQALAAAITKTASKQTYYTIRFFVDRDRVDDAYRAYGYLRWVDDVIDAEPTPSGPQARRSDTCPELQVRGTPCGDAIGTRPEKMAFVNRQKSLLEACYRGETPEGLCPEEWMLVDLVRNDKEKNSGLQAYLRNMMAVMQFDAKRRGQVITQAELSAYSRTLGVAVTEALYYFIGHDDPSPRHDARYLAVTAAHITHMLRDAIEDVEAGYYNVPQEYLRARGIAPQAVNSPAYQEWVCGRVQLARMYFRAGRECTAQVKNLRCRLAGYAYTARFEWMLRAIERDDYSLRSEYPERRSLGAGLWMAGLTLASMFTIPRMTVESRTLAAQPIRIEK